jgi:hypothetical protein
MPHLRHVAPWLAAPMLLAAAMPAAAAGEGPAPRTLEEARQVVAAIDALAVGTVTTNPETVVVAQGITLEDDWTLAMRLRHCARGAAAAAAVEACRSAEDEQSKLRASITLRDIDHSSVAVQQPQADKGEEGRTVMFDCRGDAPCIATERGGEAPRQAGRWGIPCPDDQACASIAAGLRTLVAPALIEHLRTLTVDYTWLAGEALEPVYVIDIEFDQEAGLLAVHKQLVPLAPPTELVDLTSTVPLTAVTFAFETTVAGVQTGGFDFITLRCARGEECVRVRNSRAAEEQSAPLESFGCERKHCVAIKDSIDALAAIAVQKMFAPEQAPEPASAPTAPAGSETDPVARLNALTKGYNYAGYEFGTETVKGIAFEPSLGLLAIKVDDVDETAPITALIPLRHVVVVSDRFKRGEVTTDGVVTICADDRTCIGITIDSVEEALQKLRDSPDAELSGKLRKSFGFGCKPEHCADVQRAIGELILLASAPATTEEEPAPSGLTPFQRAVAAVLGPVNQRIDRDAAPVAGLPVTQGVAVTTEGRIALLSRECDASGDCVSAVETADIIVQFAAGDIDYNSIGYQAAGGGYAVVFSCAQMAGACVASPDGRLQFRGYGLPCAGQTECNRLVIDFTSLLGQAVAWAN